MLTRGSKRQNRGLLETFRVHPLITALMTTTETGLLLISFDHSERLKMLDCENAAVENVEQCSGKLNKPCLRDTLLH